MCRRRCTGHGERNIASLRSAVRGPRACHRTAKGQKLEPRRLRATIEDVVSGPFGGRDSGSGAGANHGRPLLPPIAHQTLSKCYRPSAGSGRGSGGVRARMAGRIDNTLRAKHGPRTPQKHSGGQRRLVERRGLADETNPTILNTNAPRQTQTGHDRSQARPPDPHIQRESLCSEPRLADPPA